MRTTWRQEHEEAGASHHRQLSSDPRAQVGETQPALRLDLGAQTGEVCQDVFIAGTGTPAEPSLQHRSQPVPQALSAPPTSLSIIFRLLSVGNGALPKFTLYPVILLGSPPQRLHPSPSCNLHPHGRGTGGLLLLLPPPLEAHPAYFPADFSTVIQ